MDYSFWAVVLLVVGFLLIVAEIFLPSGGIILILCVTSFVASIWCGHHAWYETNPAVWWTYLGSIVVLVPAAVVGTFQMFQRTEFGRRILLAAPDPAEVTPYEEEVTHLRELVGKVGTAVTPLMPGGLVDIDGERLHCFTQGMLFEVGDAVEVYGVSGTRLLVKKPGVAKSQSRETPVADTQPSDSADEDAPPLDFEIPQG